MQTMVASSRLSLQRPAAASRRPATGQAAFSPARPVAGRKGAAARRCAVAASEGKESVAEDVDIDEEVEKFMKRQAEIESGAAFARTRDPAQIIGADIVSEERAKEYARGIIDILKGLKKSRDMSVNEARLVLSIEDPRMRERRGMDIEDERGVSRDEMAAALLEVAEGRLPKDRVALQCVYEEMSEWPFLDPAAEAEAASGSGSSSSTSTAAASTSADYASLAEASGIAKPYIMGKDARKGDKPQTLADLLPDWVGYGTLYGISIIPVILAGTCILVLFYNSLR